MLPHTDGAIFGAALVHIVTPRIFFPNKGELMSDSDMVRKYSNMQVAGREHGTSIAFGYAAESYIDFGVPLMFAPVFAFGVFIGFMYVLFRQLIWHRELFVSFATVAFWLSVYLFERSWANTLGIAVGFMVYLGGPVGTARSLLDGEGRQEQRHRRPADDARSSPSAGPVLVRVRVLHVSAYFPPARPYGGPPASVLGLCRGLQRAGVEVEVVTTTANGSESLPPSAPGGEFYEGVPVYYAARAFPERFFGARVRGPLTDALARADVCHIHGIWNVPEWWAAHLSRGARVPYVISPRGMLQPQAMARGRWRKAAAFALLDRRNLRGAAMLHATSEQEATALAGARFRRADHDGAQWRRHAGR